MNLSAHKWKWAMDKSLLSLVTSSSDITGTKEFLFFYHTRTCLASFICRVFFLSICAPFVTHFGFCFFWLGLGSSLSLSLSLYFLSPFAGCFVWWSLPGFHYFHHFCGFKSLVTYFLFLAFFFQFTLEKLKFSYFFQKPYHRNAQIHHQKIKIKNRK